MLREDGERDAETETSPKSRRREDDGPSRRTANGRGIRSQVPYRRLQGQSEKERVRTGDRGVALMHISESNLLPCLSDREEPPSKTSCCMRNEKG